MNDLVKIFMLGVIAMTLVSCERQEMTDGSRFKPFEKAPFFGGGSVARPLVNGTVARGHLETDTPFFTGMKKDEYVEYCPIPITREVLKRGQERFNIYCAVCHSPTGNGNGRVVQRGFPPPPSFHTDRLRNVPVGYLFQVISDGSRVMASYSDVLDEYDRWAVVLYIRTLQRSHYIDLKYAPDNIEQKLKKLEEDRPILKSVIAGPARNDTSMESINDE